ncbi:ribosome maturation factor RimP [Parasporobacterium paucivorans]|uniref:Ribosome maturation factor RimP n=1 Tax=Parasporobacterium paucivorans DSM 15970 TaxID=1122934 RepID=A0A1M6EV19_9FIRM|nr:ribosome maturation factor RimP [Parasporobacterium paucivorans]SHI89246.1 ribosome maturation factor RimP [Parasporobacterium paucivorans DSM 15970]
MSRKEYEARTEQMISPFLQEKNFELVDVEYVKEAGNYFLRLYIDKQGGITIDDCEIVSRTLSEMLDNDDFIKEAFILEVSSPGLSRPLKKDKDFQRNLGKEVELRLYNQFEKKKEFRGVLKEYSKETVTIETEDRSIEFKRAEIALIRLAFDF